VYFHKIDNPMNFRFPGIDNGSFEVKDVGEGVFSLNIQSDKWERTDTFAPLIESGFNEQTGKSRLLIQNDQLELIYNEKTLLTTKTDRAFGVSGQKWMFMFDYSEDMHFYGMGEKGNGFEKSGIKTKFWNADVWADFPVSEVVNHQTDPMYLSIPYLLIKKGNHWFGMLVDNPYPVFMATGAEETIAKQNSSDTTKDFYLGSTEGKPHLYFITGDNPAEITSKLQKLAGTVPRPPLWSLGYHQCRWGYKSYDDLKELDMKFTDYEIPCDGLWLDIDYMTGYRVFTWNKDYFKDLKKEIADLNNSGRQIVPILDPGVKRDSNFSVYQDGKKKGIFCLNTEGMEYTGFVWPGETMFPDFSMEEGRQWWADQVTSFASEGIKGVWIDMNDPATGSSELNEMKFQRGKKEHEYFHNQYSIGMQEATERGLRKANPDNRPFILSRSGFTGSSRWSAIWTGDNFSNYHNLRKNIETSLNLSMSSIPFIGSDVPGFGGDATGDLMISWFKAAFLSPVLRNHSLKDTRDQEPWAFDDKVLKIVSHYIRLRYKLLPYLYNLFIQQESSGEPILRPVYYHAGEEDMESVLYIDDQYYTGPSILQSPVVTEGDKKRDYFLPAGRWYDIQSGNWLEGNRIISFFDATDEKTALHIKDGSIIPMLPGTRLNNQSDLSVVELHIFADTHSQIGDFTYTYDSGDGYGYRKGEESRFSLSGEVNSDILEIEINGISRGYKECHVDFVFYTKFDQVLLTSQGSVKVLKLEKHDWNFAMNQQKCWKSEKVTV